MARFAGTRAPQAGIGAGMLSGNLIEDERRRRNAAENEREKQY